MLLLLLGVMPVLQALPALQDGVNTREAGRRAGDYSPLRDRHANGLGARCQDAGCHGVVAT